MEIIRDEKRFSLNLGGRLLDLSIPRILGILNATPDSFYPGSRCNDAGAIARRARQIVEEGADIIDLGAYSSRPGAKEVSPKEECRRLADALEIIRDDFPDFPVSVDTFRADVARFCVTEYGVTLINDISGGALDERMFDTVAELGVAYLLMHMRGTPQEMMQHTEYEGLIDDMLYYFSERIDRLTRLGVCDIVIDPGFGFSKNRDQNYELLNRFSEFTVFGLPLLAGISRKSMIYRELNGTPEESLNGTTVLHTLALLGGADLLRVHDVRAAAETIHLTRRTLNA